MVSPVQTRAPRPRHRAATLLLVIAALAGVLLVLAPVGAGATSDAIATGSSTWLGVPVGAVVWVTVGLVMLALGRLAGVASRRRAAATDQARAQSLVVPPIGATAFESSAIGGGQSLANCA